MASSRQITAPASRRKGLGAGALLLPFPEAGFLLRDEEDVVFRFPAVELFRLVLDFFWVAMDTRSFRMDMGRRGRMPRRKLWMDCLLGQTRL